MSGRVPLCPVGVPLCPVAGNGGISFPLNAVPHVSRCTPGRYARARGRARVNLFSMGPMGHMGHQA